MTAPLPQPASRPDAGDAAAERARADLAALERPRGLLAGDLADAARSAGRHFAARDTAGDRVETWATRLARVAALIAVLVLMAHLVATYG